MVYKRTRNEVEQVNRRGPVGIPIPLYEIDEGWRKWILSIPSGTGQRMNGNFNSIRSTITRLVKEGKCQPLEYRTITKDKELWGIHEKT